MIRTLLAALLTAAIAGTAQAQTPDCSIYKQIVDAMPANFSALKGAPLPEGGGNQTKITLMGMKASDCYIDTTGDGKRSLFHCDKFHESEAEAQKRYDTALAEARACLTGREQQFIQPNHGEGYTVLSAVGFYRPDAVTAADLELELVKGVYPDTSEVDYIVAWKFVGGDR